MARSSRRSDYEHYSGSDLGYYTRINLNDLINNFMLMYTGEGMVFRKVDRNLVAAHAQRSVQEFSYDVFHSDKNLELEVGPSNIIKLPSDFVNYNRVTIADGYGREQDLIPAQRTSASRAAAQDQNYDIITDSTGDTIYSEDSVKSERFQSTNRDETVGSLINSYFYDGGYNRDGEDFDSERLLY